MSRIKIYFATALTALSIFGGSLLLASPAMAKCASDEIELSISVDGSTNCIKKSDSQDLKTNPIYIWMIWIIKFLTAGVGLAVVGGIVWGGITYLTSRENSSQTQKAITIIVNAVIGLLLYILMFAILNFLIPGGIIS